MILGNYIIIFTIQVKQAVHRAIDPHDHRALQPAVPSHDREIRVYVWFFYRTRVPSPWQVNKSSLRNDPPVLLGAGSHVNSHIEFLACIPKCRLERRVIIRGDDQLVAISQYLGQLGEISVYRPWPRACVHRQGLGDPVEQLSFAKPGAGVLRNLGQMRRCVLPPDEGGEIHGQVLVVRQHP